jgi:hypothetical protein
VCLQHHQEHAQLLGCAPGKRVAPPPACSAAERAGRARAGNFTETELGEVKFPEISAPILEKVCQYFYYKLRYQNS